MACTSCGTKAGGTPGGCKSNGTCGTSGCNALNVYDWFKDMDLPTGYKPFNVVEIRFKGSRKEFFRNTNNLELYTGEKTQIKITNQETRAQTPQLKETKKPKK